MGLIQTPFDEDRVYVLNNTSGIPTFVMEVPGTRVDGLPVCIATTNKKDMMRVKKACFRFAKWLEKVNNSCSTIATG